jgi:sec-independent protein translocase protein TatA
MFDVGGFELVVIILAIILLFGPKSIPKFMQQVGRGVRQFRKAQEDLTQQIRDISADAAIQDALSVDTPPRPMVRPVADGVSRERAIATAEAAPSAGEGGAPSQVPAPSNPDASQETTSNDTTTPTNP